MTLGSGENREFSGGSDRYQNSQTGGKRKVQGYSK